MLTHCLSVNFVRCTLYLVSAYCFFFKIHSDCHNNVDYSVGFWFVEPLIFGFAHTDLCSYHGILTSLIMFIVMSCFFPYLL